VASTGSLREGVGECAIKRSPSGWVTTAPDRRIYPQPRHIFIKFSHTYHLLYPIEKEGISSNIFLKVPEGDGD